MSGADILPYSSKVLKDIVLDSPSDVNLCSYDTRIESKARSNTRPQTANNKIVSRKHIAKRSMQLRKSNGPVYANHNQKTGAEININMSNENQL
jgi:hypothetical protein